MPHVPGMGPAAAATAVVEDVLSIDFGVISLSPLVA